MTFLGILLLPFTIIYTFITRIRNHLYDIGYTRSFQFDTKVIGVGNLKVGGTGKTPMIEYLINLLGDEYEVSTLSRGYKRNSRGFRIAKHGDSAATIGDEPFQMYSKFSKINVAVGEDRVLAIPQILFELPETEIILMDDAFQHRSVRPNLNILLTEFDKPFFSDHVLPSGRLRESRKGASRANVIVVTKCPEQLLEKERDIIIREINKYSHRDNHIFFTTINYGTPLPVFNKNESIGNDLVLVTGIANNQLLKNYLSKSYNIVRQFNFSDHYKYKPGDLAKIAKVAKSLEASVITTEKDMVKLKTNDFENISTGIPVYYIPIDVSFIFDGRAFDTLVKDVLKRPQ